MSNQFTEKEARQLFVIDTLAEHIQFTGYKPGDNPLFDYILALLGITYDQETEIWSADGLYLPTESPKKVPYCCPVCNGKGLIPHGFYTFLSGEGMSTSATPEPCRSCGGTGIIYG